MILEKIILFCFQTQNKETFSLFLNLGISTRATRSTENSRYYRMTISIELNVGFVISTPIYVSSIKAFSHESHTREQKNPFFQIRGRTKHPFKWKFLNLYMWVFHFDVIDMAFVIKQRYFSFFFCSLPLPLWKYLLCYKLHSLFMNDTIETGVLLRNNLWWM